MEKLKVKFARIRKMLVWNELVYHFHNSKSLVYRLANLANIFDQQGLRMGYNSIISYSRAKGFVQKKNKEYSSQNIESILTDLFNRKKQSYFNSLKFRVANMHSQGMKKVTTMIRNWNNKLRAYFERWKQRDQNELMKIEMNEEGPIRDEIFEDNITF